MKQKIENKIFKDLMRTIYVQKKDTEEVYEVVYDFVVYGRLNLTNEQINFLGGKSNVKVVSKPSNYKRDRENGIYNIISDKKVF